MCLAGMNVARLNFSHGTHEEQQVKLDLIKKVRGDLNLPIALMLDTKGPEYRTGVLGKGSVTLRDGDTFSFTVEDVIGDEKRVSVSYKDLIKEMDPGDKILVSNGLLIFEVTAITKTDIVCRVVAGGELGSRKSMSFPGKVLKQTYLSEQDKSDMLFGIKNGFDYMACSFVSCAQDITDVRQFLDANGGEDIELIAKIENRSGIDNLDEIFEVCTGIMIARGDLGVEIPFEELPVIQKNIIMKCRYKGKRVITATEMLESMIHNPRPTRAEISDVANAVYDGTSAIMLSGETASGKYPVLTIQTMSRIAEETEKHIHYANRYKSKDYKIENIQDATAHSTCGVAIDIDAKAIVACTQSGSTAKMISRYRCPVSIIGLTTSERAWYKLALSWGVTPMMTTRFTVAEDLFKRATEIAKSVLDLQPGDHVVITGGTTLGRSGLTNLIKIDEIS